MNNKPGVLVRVALVFSRRGFNIESLVVSPGAEGALLAHDDHLLAATPTTSSRSSSSSTKLIDVVHAIDHTGDDAYETEIALVKLRADARRAHADPADRRALQGARSSTTAPTR